MEQPLQNRQSLSIYNRIKRHAQKLKIHIDDKADSEMKVLANSFDSYVKYAKVVHEKPMIYPGSQQIRIEYQQMDYFLRVIMKYARRFKMSPGERANFLTKNR
jgi:hypothetical protein